MSGPSGRRQCGGRGGGTGEVGDIVAGGQVEVVAGPGVVGRRARGTGAGRGGASRGPSVIVAGSRSGSGSVAGPGAVVGTVVPGGRGRRGGAGAAGLRDRRFDRRLRWSQLTVVRSCRCGLDRVPSSSVWAANLRDRRSRRLRDRRRWLRDRRLDGRPGRGRRRSHRVRQHRRGRLALCDRRSRRLVVGGSLRDRRFDRRLRWNSPTVVLS